MPSLNEQNRDLDIYVLQSMKDVLSSTKVKPRFSSSLIAEKFNEVTGWNINDISSLRDSEFVKTFIVVVVAIVIVVAVIALLQYQELHETRQHEVY